MKIFRSIRQTLIGESKFSKYLLYATGEIILVVIGILIALQINTWNNTKIDKEKEVKYLKKLASNLNDDIEEFKVLIETDSLFQESLKDLYESLNNPNIKDINDIRMRLFNLRMSFNFESNNSTFQNIVSSGQMNLISNDSIVEKLFLYYRDIQIVRNGVEETGKIMNHHVIIPLIVNLASKDHTINDLVLYQSSHALENLVILKRLNLKTKKKVYKDLLDDSQDIVDLITEEISLSD